jgi:rod shape-determining protein MreD
MKGQVITRSSLVLALAVVVQYVLLVRLRLDGAHPEFMVLLPFAAGYLSGPERGAAFGFVSGLVADMFVITPFGMSALVGCIVGYLTGLAAAGLARPSRWMVLVGGVGATAVSLAMYAMLGYVLGQPAMLKYDLLPAVLVAVPASVLLSLPAVWLVDWALVHPERMRTAASSPGGLRASASQFGGGHSAGSQRTRAGR